jgi:hypothetical protein
MTNTTTQFGDITESYIRSGRTDSKGREIGYVVGLRDDGTTFYAWVQNTRRVNGQWVEFGVQQRSKSFKSQAEATRWAYATANERISNIQKGA